MNIYVVLVHSNYGLPKISQDGYRTLKEAQEFIQARSDIKIKLNDYEYIGSNHYYIIKEIHISK